MRERFGATNPKALALRFHAQTGGSTLTAQQPENNIVRVAIQALSAIAGARSRCTRTRSTRRSHCRQSMRRRSRSARSRFSRTRPGTTATVDPFGGSFYVEELTDELEARAWELIERVDELGGAVSAIEQGFVQGEIEAAAYRWQHDVESGERVIVGVNEFVAETELPIQLQSIDPAAERRQRARTAALRAERNAEDAARSARSRARALRTGPRTSSSRCAPPSAPTARSARSAACCARSGASTTANAPRADRDADPPRLPDVSGAHDPDLGAFVAQGERALRERGHEIELAVLDRRAGGKARFLELRRRVRRAARPDVVWAHFLVPAGLIASEVDAPLVVTAHGRDVRNIGEVPGVALLTRRVVRRAATVVAVSKYLRRELEERVPQARGKIEVVDSGVDLERFQAVAPAAGLEPPASSTWAR